MVLGYRSLNSRELYIYTTRFAKHIHRYGTESIGPGEAWACPSQREFPRLRVVRARQGASTGHCRG